MKRISIFIVVVAFLFEACNTGGSNTYDAAQAMPDTAIVMEDKTDANKITKPAIASEKFVSLLTENNIEKLLCQGWVMDDDVEVLANNSQPEGNYPYRCFYFFDDHTYTRNVRNEMEYGTWQYNDAAKTLLAKAQDGSKDEYKIAAIGATDMIVLNRGSNSDTKFTFLADGLQYKDKNNDPFYIENNRWRIKPASPETNEQIQKRLKECIWFHILFYRDNLERKQKVISFYGFPTCLKWYGGGIGLIEQSELPGNWYACFYNKAQALEAQKIMGSVLTKKYKWGTGKISWVKKNLDVLEQMYANL